MPNGGSPLILLVFPQDKFTTQANVGDKVKEVTVILLRNSKMCSIPSCKIKIIKCTYML